MNEKIKPTSTADGLCQKIQTDVLKHEGKYYLVIIDYFPHFIEIIYVIMSVCLQRKGKKKN